MGRGVGRSRGALLSSRFLLPTKGKALGRPKRGGLDLGALLRAPPPGRSQLQVGVRTPPRPEEGAGSPASQHPSWDDGVRVGPARGWRWQPGLPCWRPFVGSRQPLPGRDLLPDRPPRPRASSPLPATKPPLLLFQRTGRAHATNARSPIAESSPAAGKSSEPQFLPRQKSGGSPQLPPLPRERRSRGLGLWVWGVWGRQGARSRIAGAGHDAQRHAAGGWRGARTAPLSQTRTIKPTGSGQGTSPSHGGDGEKFFLLYGQAAPKQRLLPSVLRSGLAPPA